VRRIDINKIEEAFELEHREMYGEPCDGTGLSQYFLENEWKPFISRITTGDELWFFRLPDECWEKLKEHQGYVIMRNGKSKAKVLTKWN